MSYDSDLFGLKIVFYFTRSLKKNMFRKMRYWLMLMSTFVICCLQSQLDKLLGKHGIQFFHRFNITIHNTSPLLYRTPEHSCEH